MRHRSSNALYQSRHESRTGGARGRYAARPSPKPAAARAARPARVHAPARRGHRRRRVGPDTFRFFRALGVPLRQLYGQTELIGAYTQHRGDDVDFDSAGVAFDAGIEMRIEAPDQNGVGAVVTRHPNMFLGYYKNPAATAADLRDGWMHTGDAGYFNAAGHLVIIDRIQDLATTARGARFSPQYIENKLKFSAYIAEAVILGAGRDYLAAIICIRLSIFALGREAALAFTTYTDLASRPEVYDLIHREVESRERHAPARGSASRNSCCSTRSSMPTTAN